jgi:hypothetical protein
MASPPEFPVCRRQLIQAQIGGGTKGAAGGTALAAFVSAGREGEGLAAHSPAARRSIQAGRAAAVVRTTEGAGKA